MSKKYVGIDIGNRMLKLVSASGGKIGRCATVDLPDNLVKEGRVVSPDTMASVIKNAMKENGIRARKAAVVLEDRNVYVKLVTVPLMSESQLTYNLPFEFNDYITEELNRYNFDYMVLGNRETVSEEDLSGEEKIQVLDLLAVAAPKDLLADLQEMLKKAGLKLVKAAPVITALSSLIGQSSFDANNEELCIVDIGQESIRMHVFKGSDYLVSRILTTGLSVVESRLAEYYNKDIHVAHTYLMTNFEDCQNLDVCRETFSGIATEMQRAMNFYRFSNPDSNLGKMLLCGGGAAIPGLREEIKAALDMEFFSASDLMKGDIEDSNLYPGAYGITLE